MSTTLTRRLAATGWFWVATAAALLMVPAATAQETPAPAPSAERPRVALALAGGGARGGAHIGVLKVLEEMRVPIDCVVGTSMGALVGGGYASGMPAREIEKFVDNIDWKKVVGGTGTRPLEPAEQKRFNDSSGSLELGLKNGRVLPPPALIATSRIEDVLRTYVAKARTVADFNKLPIPYRAVATDMLTGNMVVLDHGDIATAMRASMAVPGAFAPVVTDQYVLADGFVVRNLPIDVARELCGEVVIAVNLAKPKVTREGVYGPAKMLSRSNDVMSEANERLQLATLTDRDVRIDVYLGDIGAGDFERIPETIPLGEKGARAAADRLAALSVSEAEYAAWRQRVTVSQNIRITIAEVDFKGLTRVNPDYLRSITKVKPGDTVDAAAISQDAARMAALDDLEGVEYKLEGDPSHSILEWHPVEDEIGPNYLRPSVGLYGSGQGDLLFQLEVQHIRRWLNSYGAQWRNRLELGSYTGLETSLYQPLNVSQIFFIEPIANIGRSLEYVYNDYHRVAQYTFKDFGGRFDVGANLAESGQIRVGYAYYKRDVDVYTGLKLFPTVHDRDAGPVAQAIWDTREQASFANNGVAAQVQYMKSDAGWGATRDWERLEAAVRKLIPAGKNLIWLTAAAGSHLGSTLPADRAFSLGGPQSFPGYNPDEIRARRYWLVQGEFLLHVADILPIASQALYGGIGVEGAQVYERVDPVPDGKLYGISAQVGGRTPLGTLTLGVGRATGSWGAWLTLGTPVGTGSILNQPLFR
jgi:NTE family protein